MKQYAQPTGPAATLTLRMAGGSGQHAVIYRDPVECKDANPLGLFDDVSEKTVQIPAGQEVSLHVGSLGRLTSNNTGGLAVQRCDLIVTFTPEVGKNYLAQHLHSDPNGQCVLRVNEGSRIVPARQRQYTVPLFGNSPSCLPG